MPHVERAVFKERWGDGDQAAPPSRVSSCNMMPNRAKLNDDSTGLRFPYN